MPVIRHGVLLGLWVILVGCAAAAPSTLYHYADQSRHTAEYLYQAIYAASQRQQLPAQDLADARQAYATWAQHMWGYLVAAEAGHYDAMEAQAMETQLQRLRAIAERNQVAAWPQRS